MARPRPGWLSALRVVLALGALLAGQPRSGGGLELVMLDVGQGDALLLRDGDRALLVDGGGWRRPGFGGRVLLPALGGLGVRRLDAIAVTHADDDHCGGAADLVRELAVGEVWGPAGLGQTGCGERLATRAGPVLRELRLGDRRSVGRWRLEVLGPAAAEGGSDNARSLVLLARAAGRRVLLTGDVEARGEAALLSRRVASDSLACDILKVAHHGSRSSSGRSFLAAVEPRLALISAGSGNAYGHPSPAVLAALRRAGVRVLRTDQHGMVRLGWRDGEPLRIAVTAP